MLMYVVGDSTSESTTQTPVLTHTYSKEFSYSLLGGYLPPASTSADSASLLIRCHGNYYDLMTCQLHVSLVPIFSWGHVYMDTTSKHLHYPAQWGHLVLSIGLTSCDRWLIGTSGERQSKEFLLSAGFDEKLWFRD